MDAEGWHDMPRDEQIKWLGRSSVEEKRELLGVILCGEVEDGGAAYFDAAEIHDMLMNGVKGVNEMTDEELREELLGYANGETDPERRLRPRWEDRDAEGG